VGLGEWFVDAPGNRIRPHVQLADIGRPVGISTAVGLRGSAGLIVLGAPDAEGSLLLWPLSTDELNDARIIPSPNGLIVEHRTGVATAGPSAAPLTVDSLQIGAADTNWDAIRPLVTSWWAPAGITTPADPAVWAVAAAIYEAQVGFSVFTETRYEPYPGVHDLIADVPRIAGLGFEAIQLMPRQPYPSYNVHDYADVDTSYGPEADIRELVVVAHEHGLRLILDVLMHGVIDRESIGRAADGVRQGPYADRLGEPVDLIGSDPTDADAAAIPWSRHILDFENYWREGSPERHRLVDEHPDWFSRDTAGGVVGIYTQAFDLSHPDWQRYFVDSTIDLVRRLGIDGFRFDAPSYNAFPNWSPRTRARASAATLGARSLFRVLRERLRAERRDLVMYTEPSGAMWRESMDLVYNYDEQWLFPALRSPPGDETWLVRSGAELAAWMRDRDATLPPGSVTVHHIDSHDTFWWPLPGAKWRREQFGLPATRALLAAFSLCGGPFMSFVGAEQGVEAELGALLALRRDRDLVRLGTVDYDGVRVDRDEVFALVRRFEGEWSLVLVNFSPAPVTVRARVAGDSGQRLSTIYGSAEPDRDDGAITVQLEGFGAVVIVPV
ncbi:MAG TPA: alpha-amylase family glycosyl hydrolase, partial [Pseudolysinimonas sp.]|nr:alpha-amylase family glycosyl hydrolase [Pseudolysinimonas sp.]